MISTVVTLSCSRAWVHSAWRVYSALPSASSDSTGRSGAATAAPVAAGIPCPIAPPVRVSRVCRGAPARAVGSAKPEVLASSAMMTCSGSDAAIVLARLIAFSGPGSAGGTAGSARTGSVPAATRSASSSSAPSTSWSRSARVVTAQSPGTRSLAVAGVGEERHRRARPGQDQVRDPGQLALRPTRPGRPAGRRRAARRRVPSGPGTSRPAAASRSRRRSGWPPAARARSAPARRGRASWRARPRPVARSSIVDQWSTADAADGCWSDGRLTWTGRGGARAPPSVQETSAGRIRVAIWPAWAAASARIASWARSRGWPLVCTQPDTVRARASMSDWSGAS